MATSEQAASLRADLADSGWGVEVVAALLGEVADTALRREIRLPTLQAVRAALATEPAPSPVVVLTVLSMLGKPVPTITPDAVLPRTATTGATAIGLVDELDESGCVRVLVDLHPHEAADNTGEARWRVASDLGKLTTGWVLAPNHALGVGDAGPILAGLTSRTRAGTALDLGRGCGIQTLYLLRHAKHVVTTDTFACALIFAAFNAALASVSVTGAPGVTPGADAASEFNVEPGPASDLGRLELLRGSLLEPVAGCRFDLIAPNPPFVLTPPAVRETGPPLMEYRGAGDSILPGFVVGLAEHLEPGATAVMLGNWEHRDTGPWHEVMAIWTSEGPDARIFERELQDSVKYTTMWLCDGGLAPERDPEAFGATPEAWIDDFEARDVRGADFDYLIVHRPCHPHEPWRLLEEVTTSGQRVLGPHIAEVLEVRERLVGPDDDAVADLCPLLASDVAEERHLIPGAAEPTVILLCQDRGLGHTLQASMAVTALAGVADGELSAGQVTSTVTALSELNVADILALCAEMTETTRHLLTMGSLYPGK